MKKPRDKAVKSMFCTENANLLRNTAWKDLLMTTKNSTLAICRTVFEVVKLFHSIPLLVGGTQHLVLSKLYNCLLGFCCKSISHRMKIVVIFSSNKTHKGNILQHWKPIHTENAAKKNNKNFCFHPQRWQTEPSRSTLLSASCSCAFTACTHKWMGVLPPRCACRVQCEKAVYHIWCTYKG